MQNKKWSQAMLKYIALSSLSLFEEVEKVKWEEKERKTEDVKEKEKRKSGFKRVSYVDEVMKRKEREKKRCIEWAFFPE
jgi:hypothetical protein